MVNVRINWVEALRKGRPFVELAPEVRIPSRFGGDIQGDEFPYDIAIEVAFEDGRFVCETLHCHRKPGGPPVKTELIRQLPVAELVRLLASAHRVRVTEPSPGELVVEPFDLPEPRTEDGPTEEVLAGVALAYRFAFATGESPTKVVMNHFKVSRATAGRWVSMARDLGFIGKTEERKAAY